MSETKQKNSTSPFLPWMSCETDCDQIEISLSISTLFVIANFDNTWTFRRNICDASATPSGIRLRFHHVMMSNEEYISEIQS
jgi:hypothetical protein